MAITAMTLAALSVGCVPPGALSSGDGDDNADILRVGPADAGDGEADTGRDGGAGDGGADVVDEGLPERPDGLAPPPPDPDAGIDPPEPEPMPDPEPAEPEPPPDPCVDVMCVANAACVDGECVCEPGFVLDGQACVAPVGSPLEQRTDDEVCGRWLADRVDVPEAWAATEDIGACDPGTIAAAAHENAMRRTNLFRWLAGAPPVVTNFALLEQQQACAALQVALGRLNHQPGPGSPCYTEAGARGAGSSNLAAGAGVADSVDLYVGDRGVASLGHRRWVLNPSARETAFGWKDRFSCMYSFSQGAQHTVEVMAWPPPGPVPVDIPRGQFSVQLYGVSPGPDFTISVGIDGAAPTPIAATPLPVGFGGRAPAYAFDPGNVYAAGRSVEVLLDGLSDSDPMRWQTRFVSCR